MGGDMLAAAHAHPGGGGTEPAASRPTGIEVIGEAPWGSHFCQFYATRDDLAEVLVPYFKAGLESGEHCMWVTSPPLEVGEAWELLGRAMPDLARYRERGCIEILPYTEWYLQQGRFETERVLAGWVARHDRALDRGCAGLRLSGNTFWLEDSVWQSFAEYEAAIDATIGRYRMMALCTYSLERCGALEIADVIKNHQFALLKRDGAWEVIESFDRRRLLEEGKEALRHSEERLRLAQVGAGVGVWDLDTRTGELECTSELSKLYGMPAGTITCLDDWRRRVHPDDHDRVMATRTGAIAARRPFELEFRILRGDGEIRWVCSKGSAIYDREGEALRVLGMDHDVTARREAEEARRASEARFKLLSGTAGLLLATERPEAVVEQLCRDVMVHLGCELFFNYLTDPSSGRLQLNACAGIPPEDARRIEWLDPSESICGRVAREGRRIVVADIQRTDHPAAALVRSYGVQAYCCHPLLAQGRVLGTLSFGTRTRPSFSDDEVDLMKIVADQVALAIQRVQTEEALRAANTRLVEADRRKNDFLGMLSHELRNPLAPIHNSLYILDQATPDCEQAHRAHQVIRRQVTHLNRLVDDLLDVTRITRGKVQLHREHLDLADLVHRTVEDYRPVFAQNGIRLEVEIAAGPLRVHGDRTRLAQAVGNLLNNAAKFTPRGSRTVVSVERGSMAGLPAKDGDGIGEGAVIRVRDDGVGIAAEMLPRLFEPFSQADQNLDRSKGGLGLGLALVKGMIDLHGGTVAVRSEGPGKGAEFTIVLPLEVGAQEQCSAAGELHSSRPRRVLVIEDNVDAADTLCEVLSFCGHEVAVAYGGREGVGMARAFRPEIVFCDIGLPEMDGYAVAQALRADEACRDAFLVALTGYARPEDQQRAIQVGFQLHLAKPASMEQIREVVGQAG